MHAEKKMALHNGKSFYSRPERTGMAAGYGNGSRVKKTVVNTMIPGKEDPSTQGSKQGFGAPMGNTSPVGFGKIKSTSKNGRGSVMNSSTIGGKTKLNKEDIARC